MKYSYEYKLECVELYRKGEWSETPKGLTQKTFRNTIRKWLVSSKSEKIEIR